MRIGVLGSGVVGKVLAAGFAGHQHEVMIGSRSPEKLVDWLRENPGVGSGLFGDVAAFADVIVLAVKGTAANEALAIAGEDSHAGKPVIDATNPIADEPPVNGVLRFFTSLDESLMEQLQRQYPRTRFVKAFSSVSSAHGEPALRGRQTEHVHLRQRRRREAGRHGHSRAIRLGNRGYGCRGSGTRHRAALHAVLHPGVYPRSMDACIQVIEIKNKNKGRRSVACAWVPRHIPQLWNAATSAQWVL